ncbi:Uncharacterised protein [Mycobacteroides abscessus subsp. abscessus]|nr:Uncharacterised protein [Mycobacteroides abscessus subsp. abscessus]
MRSARVMIPLRRVSTERMTRWPRSVSDGASASASSSDWRAASTR